MLYHFDETETFIKSLDDIKSVVSLIEDSDKRVNSTLLKLSVVGLVTKFQVYIENVLESFLYKLQHGNIKSSKLNSYIKLNSIFIQLNKENDDLKKFRTYYDNLLDMEDKIIDELKKFGYLHNDIIIDDSFSFNIKFPIGKTGTKELSKLLKQFDGDDNPLAHDFSGINIDKNKIDSMLGIRNSIVHQDIYNGTKQDIEDMIQTCFDIGKYIDEYIYQKTKSYLLDVK